MPRFKLKFALFFAALALSGCGKESERTSTELGVGGLRWGTFPVEVQVDAFLLADPKATADLNDAIAFWEEKAGKRLFTIAGSWDSAQKPFSGPIGDPTELLANVILFQGPWPFDNRIAGKTVVHSTNGTISRAVIFLNAETALCGQDCRNDGSEVSRRKLLAHELGHYLGLGHNQDRSDVMYPEILQGGSLEGLKVDESLLTSLTQ
jgi:hypothetical protein